MSDVLLYGSYGYTGELIAEAAVDRGIDPILAGRREQPLVEQADELGVEYRAFDLSETDRVTEALDEVAVVLNCAGPVKRTYEPLVEAALDTGTHYLDITGEIEVFRSVATYDEAAEDAGIMLMSGVGFDVVPTDCVAARIADRLPDADSLSLGFHPRGLPSGGTLKTAIEDFTNGGYVRRNGELTGVQPAHSIRRIDFGRGTTGAVAIPWGDVETAYQTTGIPNIDVFLGVPTPVALSLRGAGPVSYTHHARAECRPGPVDGPRDHRHGVRGALRARPRAQPRRRVGRGDHRRGRQRGRPHPDPRRLRDDHAGRAVDHGAHPRRRGPRGLPDARRRVRRGPGARRRRRRDDGVVIRPAGDTSATAADS